MPKVKKIDESLALAETLLDALESRRLLGVDAYPTTLRQLAETAGVPPGSDALLLKAAGKKPFKDRAGSTEKLTPDSRVSFKEDLPTRVELLKREVADLAGKMLLVLESQRPLGPDAYPPTFGRLAELCGLKFSDKKVPLAAAHEGLTRGAVIVGTGKKHGADAPVVLSRDLDSSDLVPSLLAFAFGQSRNESSKALAFTPDQLSKKLPVPLRARFVDGLAQRIKRQEMPAEFAWVPSKAPLVFLATDVQPAAPRRSTPAEPTAPRDHGPTAPARDFAVAFREAFERIDRRNGKTNNVRLLDLRRELADHDRARFDAGLDAIRGPGREYSLDSHEGLLRPLTPEERDAGINDAGSLLVYVSRR